MWREAGRAAPQTISMLAFSIRTDDSVLGAIPDPINCVGEMSPGAYKVPSANAAIDWSTLQAFFIGLGRGD